MTAVIEKEAVAPIDDFLRLREITGLTPRAREAAELGLKNSLYGVHLCVEDKVVAMGRVVGDGGLNFEIVDIAVDPDYQGLGLGRQVMQAVMKYLDKAAGPTAYITLMADVPELYEKFGFVPSAPGSIGMHIIRPPGR